MHVDGLHVVLETRRRVQIEYQILDLQTLRPDQSRIGARALRQVGRSRKSVGRLLVFAIIFAKVVFPVPGGP